MKKYLDKQTVFYINKKNELKKYNYTYLRDYDSVSLRNKRLLKKIKNKRWNFLKKNIITDLSKLYDLATYINNEYYFTQYAVSKILNIQYSKFLKWLESNRFPKPPYIIEGCSNYKYNCKFYPLIFIKFVINIFSIYYKYNKVYDLRYKRSRDLKSIIFKKYEELFLSAPIN